MLTKTAIGFAVVALALAAAAFQPASANYAPCVENPEGAGCPANQTPRLSEACSVEARDACPQLSGTSSGHICLLKVEHSAGPSILNAPSGGVVSLGLETLGLASLMEGVLSW